MREHVGHDLIVMPAVSVLVWDAQGRLLLVREAETGRWQTVGGAIEPDEDPYAAALREAREEAGVDVRIDRIRTVLGGPRYRLVYPNSDIVSYVSIVFDASIVAGTPAPDGDETTETGWFARDELGRVALTAFTVELLDDALNSRTDG